MLCDQPILGLLLGLLATTLSFATPITLGALSGLACERSGVVNIAIEGMMLSAAFVGFWAEVTFHNVIVAVLAGILAGGLMALLHGLLSISFKVDQIISGTVINILGVGATTYLYGQWYAQNEPSAERLPRLVVPGTTLSIQLLTVVAVLLVFVAFFVLNYTPWGLRVRAVG